jgi:OOP family OmpA-OmpF porin
LLNKEGFSSLSDVNFELNQSGVNQSFNSVLNEIISLLKSNPNSVLALEGHTDATGETNFNNELSLKRANALKAYFVSKGIDPNRIQVGSFGESKPKYLNKTPTGRALNRRVEIYIKE